jgi:membrane-bound serine protease (ClpP class)
MTFAIVLLFLGLVFLVAEIFFTSFGLFGVLSAAALIGGIVVAFEESRGAGIGLLAVTLVLAPVVLSLAIKVFPKTPFGKQMILAAAPNESNSATATTMEGGVGPGDSGIALSQLRPSGIAEFAGRRVDVVTEGSMVARGARLRVTNVSGNRVVVEEVENGGAA